MTKFSSIYIGSFLIFISILSFINIIYSNYFDIFFNIETYVYTFAISFILGSLLFYLNRKSIKKITLYEKIFTVLLGYFLFPLIISIPYYFSIQNISLLNSYFEAISGFTSTGFTIFDNIKQLDESLILWRSTSQWIGGIYFLFSILLLIDIFDKNLKKSFTEYLSFNYNEIFKQSLKIIIIYTLLTLLIFIVFKILNLRTFDAFNLSLSIISSGGFLPVNELSMIIKENAQIIIFSLMMLFSFFSLFFSYNLIFLRKKNVNFFYEDLHLFVYLLIVVTIFFLFFSFNYDFFINLFAIISSMTNIGFSLSPGQENLNFIYLILVIIGGSFFSTSSGLRFIKIYSLFKFSLNQILSFSRPKNVFMNKLIFTKINFNPEEINKYFLTIIIFILSLSILTSLLSLSGITFVNSFKLSILTLMNTVNSSIYGLEEFDFYNLQLFSKYCLIFFMIVGRIELLTILLLIKKFLFKN